MSNIIQQIHKKLKGSSPGDIIIATILFISFITFLLLLIEVVLKYNYSFDEFVFRKLRLVTTSALTKFMLFITFFGSFNFLLPAYIVVIIFYLLKKEKKLSILITLAGLSSTAVLFFLKSLVKRSRPLDPLQHAVNGFSFPSGHAFAGFIFFGILIYIVWQCKMKKYLKWLLSTLLFLFISLIALSRIYLHVHFASDVLAGFCLAVTWLMFLLIAVKLQKQISK